MKLAAADFDYLRRLIEERSSIVVGPDQAYLMESRLAALARETGPGGLPELVRRLRVESYGRLHARVVEAMTTNETTFFRDVHPFAALREHVLPDLASHRTDARPLSIWSAACSTGQEPYSIAMLLLEHFPDLHRKTSILATDVAPGVVDRTRRGSYTTLEVRRGLPQRALAKYFETEGTSFRIVEAARRLVEARVLNLASRASVAGSFDLILLRNVLIYFSAETRVQVLETMKRCLRPDGYLLLGTTETTHGLSDDFRPMSIGRTTFFRLKG